ncbi:MAG: OmpA family protein [Kiritimatiellaeota bacterium]|nr:OmpA family protein [Kiritimatiellota bacterium]
MKICKLTFLTLAAATIAIPAFAQEPVEKSDFGRWYISPGIGVYKPEGDDPLKSGPILTIRLGYDYNEWWSVEGSFLYAWKLKENLGGYNYKDTDGVWRSHSEPYSYSERLGGVRDFGDTWMAQIYADALFHFSKFDKFDPYLTFGVGCMIFGEDIAGGKSFAIARVGGGFMYHLSDSWTLRVDARTYNSGYNNDFSQTFDIGFVYRFTADRIADDPKVNLLDPPREIAAKNEPVFNEMFRFDITFDTSKNDIKDVYHAQLDTLADRLSRSPDTTATIEGHADKRVTSSWAYNKKLSEDRAIAVRDYLVSKGVNSANLTPVGHSYDRPIAENDPIEGNVKNRRVDVKVNNKAKNQI